MTFWTAFVANASAVVALIGAAIALGTFFYKDIVERGRRQRLGEATLVYQMRLLAYAVENGEVSAPLLSPAALLPFADLYMIDDPALRALDVFNREYTRWKSSVDTRQRPSSAEQQEVINRLQSACQHFFPSIGVSHLTIRTQEHLGTRHEETHK